MLKREKNFVGYEQLWAPWRLAYLQGESDDAQQAGPAELLPGADPQCFLCQSVAAHDDRRRHVIARTERSVVVLNRYPYNNGHLLVAPRQHRARLDQLTGEEHCDLAETLTRMVNLLEGVLSPQGFNVGLNLGQVAGAGLPGHLHWHIVPRWQGDTNFMPALAAVKVIPQALDTLWEALREALDRPK